ncbi:hypothetical protein K7432_002346 [Basidiobolus ranarum]|uniref:G-protein coupled receptors family 1 profile domain-containing protein n=1 Tax=Basidiobolus ranarum TaxID=34480 RepID=A0ABR2W8W0_9FUNG
MVMVRKQTWPSFPLSPIPRQVASDILQTEHMNLKFGATHWRSLFHQGLLFWILLNLPKIFGQTVEHSDNELNLYTTNYPGSILIFISGISSSMLNVFGSSYVIYISWADYKSSATFTNPLLRFPYHSACISLGFGVLSSINLGYASIYGKPLEGTPCNVLALLIYSLLLLDILLVGAIAFSTYLKICRNHRVDFGKFDWKLLVVCFCLVTLITAVSSLLDGFGGDTYWCFINDKQNSGERLSITYFLLIIYISLLLITSSYLMVMNRLNVITERMLQLIEKSKECSRAISIQSRVDSESETSSANSSDNLSEFTEKLEIPGTLDRATQRIFTHVLLHLLHYIPMMVYLIGKLCSYYTSWVYTVSIVLINTGGIWRALYYGKGVASKKALGNLR